MSHFWNSLVGFSSKKCNISPSSLKSFLYSIPLLFKRRGVYLSFGVLSVAFISKSKSKQNTTWRTKQTETEMYLFILSEISKILSEKKTKKTKEKLNCSETSLFGLSQQNITFLCLSPNKRHLFEWIFQLTPNLRMRRLFHFPLPKRDVYRRAVFKRGNTASYLGK